MMQGGPARSIHRLRNLLRPPKTGETFSAGGSVEQALAGSSEPLRLLMRKLSARIGRERWVAPIRPDIGVTDNPLIPAGYTYLLQLVAHDLVHSSVSLAGSAWNSVGLANTRLFPLTLETIYGGGPDVSPQAYEIDQAHRQNAGIIPRTRFRVGQVRNLDRTMNGCPFRDIGRAIPAHVEDGGLARGERLSLDRSCDPWRTEALLADPRNDDHALLSQLVALFHGLHNLVIDMIPESVAMAAFPPPERAYRRFLCAQSVVTLIYRNILVKDLLALILHPDVYDRYTGALQVLHDDDDPATRDAVPVEFTAAAFRFAHCMVRDAYKVNSEVPIPFGKALRLSSLRMAGELPVDRTWVVDWSRFFKTSDREPNYSHRIGPVFAGPLTNSSTFKRLTEADTDGLPNRDLVTGCFSHLWSVPALCSELRARGLGALVPDYGDWKATVRSWLEKPASVHDLAPLSPADIDILTNDPPLLLFVLLEAAQPISPATSAINHAAGESLHLGAVGSVIVAETILGALRRTPIAFETAGPHVKDRIEAACQDLLGDAKALDAIPEIAKMSELVDFMIKGGALPP